MAEQKDYKTTLKTTPLLYLELKKLARLKTQTGLTGQELVDKAVDRNIFQVNTERRAKVIAKALQERLLLLDTYLQDKLLHGTLSTSKQIALYALMKTDRLFTEFMVEVYCDKYTMGDPCLKDKDFNLFFQAKSEQSDRVASWSEYTHYKLKQVFIRILYEAGWIEDQKNRTMNKPVMEHDVQEHLRKQGEKRYLYAMLGEV